MLNFKVVRYKNFLSTGSQFTEIQLDRNHSTLIVGQNGSGKTSSIESICFALYGKPFRNINKSNLINSINKKDCLVEIEFSVGEKQYKIRRGIKPNIFEIYLNGDLVNQDSAVRDYQKYLEDSILKMNFKAFTQIVILGSTSFVPFMRLPAAARREVIDNLLDVNIFSVMADRLKEKIKDNKQSLQDSENSLTLSKQKVDTQKRYIETLESDNKKKQDDLQASMDKTRTEVDRLIAEADRLDLEVNELKEQISDSNDVKSRLTEIKSDKVLINSQIKSLKTNLEFYTDNQTCPTCDQCLEEDHKTKNVNSINAEIDQLNAKLNQLNPEQEQLALRLTEITAVQEKIDTKKSESVVARSRVNVGNEYYKKLEKEFTESQISVNITDEKLRLKELALDALQITQERNDLREEKQYYDACSVLLKDSGIKTRIVKQFLPVINNLVNKYLAEFDFFVSFELDDNFNETIKSRYRDDFTYESFSEGEKQKVDLSLLLTWRTIAKMKNSASTNLLICDEVLDSHLDPVSTDALLRIFGQMENTNLIVISHNPDQYYDKFRSVIKFEKVGNYSRIAQ